MCLLKLYDLDTWPQLFPAQGQALQPGQPLQHASNQILACSPSLLPSGIPECFPGKPFSAVMTATARKSLRGPSKLGKVGKEKYNNPLASKFLSLL